MGAVKMGPAPYTASTGLLYLSFRASVSRRDLSQTRFARFPHMRHLLGVPRQLVQHSTKKSSGALRVRNAAEASSVVCGQHVGSCGCACSLQLSVNEPGHVTHAAFDVKQLVHILSDKKRARLA